jgi:hypothetical protein
MILNKLRLATAAVAVFFAAVWTAETSAATIAGGSLELIASSVLLQSRLTATPDRI